MLRAHRSLRLLNGLLANDDAFFGLPVLPLFLKRILLQLHVLFASKSKLR